MSLSIVPNLFQPIKLGGLSLQHRVVLSPLTRYKSTQKGHVPVVSLMKPYYTQRASHPGTFMITEATYVSARGSGYDYVPGIYSQEQIAAWKEIVDSVHEQGSYIYLQLWTLGRSAIPATIEEYGFPVVGPSPIAIPGSAVHTIPRELTVDEIKQYVEDYGQAARNGLEAGFDGIELHFANGFLPDQFMQDVSNQRTDEYGGSIENRARFPLELIAAVSEAIGENRAAVRISPWGRYNGMRMNEPDMKAQYSYFVRELKRLHPDLSYLHVVEPHVSGVMTFDTRNPEESNDFLREIWAPKLFISAGGYNRDSGIERAQSENELVAFGKLFIANPDLVTRLKNESPLNVPDSSTFYTRSDNPSAEIGYLDYPFLNEEKLATSPRSYGVRVDRFGTA